MMDSRKGSQQTVQDRVGRKPPGVSRSVAGVAGTRRPRVEEARGKEGREEGALWKEGGKA